MHTRCSRLGLFLVMGAALAVASCSSNPKDLAAMTYTNPSSPLRDADLVSFLVTADAKACRAFYETKLGFRVVSDDSFGLVLDAHGRSVRVQVLGDHVAKPYTSLGWNVADIESTIDTLATRGIKCEQFGTFPQDARGIASFPGGVRVAWFKDPDGNILSLCQLPR